ncbi:MAG: maltooligosyltrehalose trehalohydrolase [Verrucomicrobiota bacterium]
MKMRHAVGRAKQRSDRRRDEYSRRMAVGAEMMAGGGVHFRLWAPKAEAVRVVVNSRTRELEAEGDGYFSGLVTEAEPGMVYRFDLNGGLFPDPVSRFQPEGPHGPSEIVDPSGFKWTDQKWGGVSRRGQVIYEMHIGTFTREGTWTAAAEQLEELAELGITLVELMPVADFPGRFGWGYDGVNLFAPTRLYGRPDDFRAFVDRAHRLGVGVILDVVYNHFGPDGNYLHSFSEDYFTDRYQNEWGRALNFDGENCGPAREFFAANAAYWIEEFHLDGLRLDATQQIFDASPEHIVGVITQKVRAAAAGASRPSKQTRAYRPLSPSAGERENAAGKRSTYIVAENETQEARLARSIEEGGYGVDALWNDDFHHSAMAALTGRNEAYYSDYKGAPQELISAAKRGYLYQGQWYSWQKKRRGTSAAGLEPNQFVNFIQNHDQVANSLRGLRVQQLTDPGRFRAMTALLLLGPGTPMLFQGQEFGASAPFLYFADHNPELAKLVNAGRKEFLCQFKSLASAETTCCMAMPHDEKTFLSCKLDFSEREKHTDVYQLHRDLLRLRREDPVFSKPRAGGVDGAVLSAEAFVLRFFGEAGNDRVLLVNLGLDLHLNPAPEPLLAPAEGQVWEVIWSSEATCYGGCGAPPSDTEGNWIVPGHAAVVMGAGGKAEG